MEDLSSTIIVGRNIYNARTKRGLTQTDVYIASGVAQNRLSQLESGKRRISIDVLVAIAQALDAPLTELLADLPTMEKAEIENRVLEKYRTDTQLKTIVDAWINK